MSRSPKSTPSTPLRALLYLRQSQSKEESISLLLQETAARDYCARMGYTVVGVEADPGMTGRTWKRPAVQRVMAALEDGHANVIVLWRWSRLSRSRKDWALAIDRADLAGGAIESATEPNDKTAAGRFARGVMTELAAFESERIGENWREVHENRVGRGLPSGRLPWGWTHERGDATPNPAQAPAIPELYSMYLGGAGGREMASWLESSGYLTYYGKTTWNHKTVTAILDSPIHSGQITYKGQLHDGAHHGLVSPETWEKYRALRLIRASERAARHTYLLSGLITCGTCKAPMFGLANRFVKTPGADTYHAYRCKTVSATKGHGPASVTTRLVDPAFHDWLDRYGNVNVPWIPGESPDTTDRIEAERIAREIASIDTETLNLTLKFGAHKIPERAYDAAMAHHGERRATLAATLARLEATLTVQPDNPRQDAKTLLDEWDVLPLSAIRVGIRSLVHTMTIHHEGPRRLEISPRVGKPVSMAL